MSGLLMSSPHITDECDMIFDPLKSELNFPIGERFEVELGPLRWQLICMLISGIFAAASDKDYLPPGIAPTVTDWQVDILAIREVLRAGVDSFFVQTKPSIVILNKEWYFKCLAKPIATWALRWFEDPGVPFDSKSIPRDVMIDYIAGKDPSKMETIFLMEEGIPIILQFARKCHTILLPHCLSKRLGIDYGLLQSKHVKSWEERKVPAELSQSRMKLAVPFQGLETPSTCSEFASPGKQPVFFFLKTFYFGTMVS